MILKLHWAGALAALWVSPLLATAATQDFASALDLFADSRVKQANTLTDLVAAGATTLPVIINLELPPEVRAFSDWRNPVAAGLHRQTVAVLQDTMMIGLPAADFVVRHRLENQATLSGDVSLRGLRYLLTLPFVDSIEFDRPIEAHTDQGITLMNADAVRSQYDGSGVSIAIEVRWFVRTGPVANRCRGLLKRAERPVAIRLV